MTSWLNCLPSGFCFPAPGSQCVVTEAKEGDCKPRAAGSDRYIILYTVLVCSILLTETAYVSSDGQGRCGNYGRGDQASVHYQRKPHQWCVSLFAGLLACICLCVCQSVCKPHQWCVSLFVGLLACICLYVCQSVCKPHQWSVSLFVGRSVYMSVCQPVCRSVGPPVHSSVRPSVRQSLSVLLSVLSGWYSVFGLFDCLMWQLNHICICLHKQKANGTLPSQLTGWIAHPPDRVLHPRGWTSILIIISYNPVQSPKGVRGCLMFFSCLEY